MGRGRHDFAFPLQFPEIGVRRKPGCAVTWQTARLERFNHPKAEQRCGEARAKRRGPHAGPPFGTSLRYRYDARAGRVAVGLSSPARGSRLFFRTPQSGFKRGGVQGRQPRPSGNLHAPEGWRTSVHSPHAGERARPASLRTAPARHRPLPAPFLRPAPLPRTLPLGVAAAAGARERGCFEADVRSED